MSIGNRWNLDRLGQKVSLGATPLKTRPAIGPTFGMLLLGFVFAQSVEAQVPGICMEPSNFSGSVSLPPTQETWSRNPTEEEQRQLYRLISAESSRLASRSGRPDDLLLDSPKERSENPSDDPLSAMGPDLEKEKERQERKESGPKDPPNAAVDPHAEVFAETLYPSAIQCAKCHKQIYDEWRVSSHAYAAVSPMFHRFEQTVATLTKGTSGTFCMRCHAPIATQLNHPREASIFDGPTVFREGITCVVCHRVVERYGRVNGERRVESGSIYDPVVGSWGGDGIARVIRDADNYKIKTDPNDKRPLQPIHRAAIQFEQLSDSSYCAGCHQVVVQPGIGLEIVYQQYRSGPACKKGISCQDCHMGLVPGKPSGYATAPAATISNKGVTPHRKHANHMFYGPMYPIAHPGVFPHNEKSLRWTVDQWLHFDWRSGWGTEDFEREIAKGNAGHLGFVPPWNNAQERRDARKVIDENQKLVDVKRANAIAVLENGSRIDGPFFQGEQRASRDLDFEYHVTNLSEGHNMPSGSLGAQPQLWLNVVLIGPMGNRLWESGFLDANGDLADNHSLLVRNGSIQPDSQLVNYQTRFLITNLKGTDREMYLPVNVDIDPLPFFRPGAVPYTVLNHAPFARMESRSIPPLDSRRAKYSIPGKLLQQPGRYRLSARLRSRVEPIYFVKFVQGTPEMERMLNEGILDVHPYSTEFDIR